MIRIRKSLIDSTVKRVPFFSCLSEEEFSDLREVMVDKSFKRNTIIFMEQDTQNYMYVVLSGKVRVINTDPDGREHILAYHCRGDFFGEMALLDGMTAPATVLASEDTTLSILSKKDFDRLILSNNRAMRELILVLCKRLRHAWMMQHLISVPSARDRVVTLLRHMAELKGVREKGGTLIDLRLTHQDIADYTSLTRETVSRILSALVRERKIYISEKHYILPNSPLS